MPLNSPKIPTTAKIGGIIVLVIFFITIEVAVLLKNYPILSGRSMWLFRRLELQNLSIISDFRHSQEKSDK